MLSVLAGSELAELEPALRAAATQAGLGLKISYAGMLDMVERADAGEPFDALLPASGAYAQLALKNKPLAQDKLFYSRVALGVTGPVAKALGWDQRTPDWAEVAQQAARGRLRYAMSNPTRSNSGMSALFAVACAVAGKTDDLTVADINPQVLTQFLSGHQLTAGSSGWLAEAYVREAARLDAMINYEAVLLRLNRQLPPAQQLTLLYPRDGVMSADYPLLLLKPERREAHRRWVEVLKGLAFQRDVLPGAFLRPSHADAPLAQALPRSPVVELSFPNRLEVIEAVLQAWQEKWRKPATSIFVLDVSGSMQGKRLEAMRHTLKVLGGADNQQASSRHAHFQQRERVVVLTFASQVAPPQTIVFEGSQLQAGRQQLQALADGLQARDGTAVYSALAVAEELARQELARDPQRFVSIALLTDGQSNQGLPFEQWRNQAQRQAPPVRIFPVLFGESHVAQMNTVAELSGGRVFDSRQAALLAVFKDIRGYQ